MHEQRKFTRLPLDGESATVIAQDRKRYAAQILNRSGEGFGLRMAESVPIKRHDLVAVVLDEQEYIVEVRNKRVVPNGVIVGVVVQEAVESSRKPKVSTLSTLSNPAGYQHVGGGILPAMLAIVVIGVLVCAIVTLSSSKPGQAKLKQAQKSVTQFLGMSTRR